MGRLLIQESGTDKIEKGVRYNANEKGRVKRDEGQDKVGWGVIQSLNVVVAASDMIDNVEIILLWSTHKEIFVPISFIGNSTTSERSYSNHEVLQ